MHTFLTLSRLGVVLAAFLFSATTQVSAAFTVKFTDGGFNTTITDNGAGDSDGSLGTITVVGKGIGGTNASPNYVITSFSVTSTSQDGTGFSGSAVIRRRNTTDSNPLVINVSSDGFNYASTGATGLLMNGASSSNLAGNATTSYTATSYLDGANTPSPTDGQSTPTLTFTPSNLNPATNPTTANATVTASPFTLSNQLTLTNLTKNSSNTAIAANITFGTDFVAAVPVPPALALLASGMPFALVYLRRRKTA